MTNRGPQRRTRVHPLFALIGNPPVYVLRKALGIEPITAVRIVTATVASLWISVLFLLLRLIGCRRFDATLFSILAATSASAVFWFVVPETFSFGSLTILLALGLVVMAQHRQFSPLWYVIVSALTLSITVTNWMVGILATIANHPWKRSLKITGNAFCLVVVLWGVQKFIFPSTKFFIAGREELRFMVRPNLGHSLNVGKYFVFHSMIMPAITVYPRCRRGGVRPVRITKTSLPGSGSQWGVISVGLWTALLGLGLWGFFSVGRHRQLRIVLGLTLLGQLALHLVYGTKLGETFLFSLYFLPLLVVLAALSTFTRARTVALVLTGALALCAGINNGLQFKKATENFKCQYGVRKLMQLRPAVPWPRGRGHVVFAMPGSREVDKAYHEPGGSFSPAVGSFGVSIWITDMEGNLETTSDNVPLSEIHQQLSWTDLQDIPEINTKTSDYQALSSSTGPGRWVLNLKTQANKNTKLMVVIRSHTSYI